MSIPDECFKRLGDQLSLAKPDPKAISPVVPKGKLIQTKFGVVDDTTTFSHKQSVARKYKQWASDNHIPWKPKGNNPLLYEKNFLETLTADDFISMKTLTAQAATEESITGTVTLDSQSFAAKFKSEKIVKIVDTDARLELEHANRTELVKTSAGNSYVRKYVEQSEITGEEIYYDFSRGIGSDIVPPAAKVAEEEMVSKFVTKGKSPLEWRMDFYEESEAAGNVARLDFDKAFTKYMMKAREGSDAIFMDHIFNQVDRNAGNFLVDYNTKTKVVNGIKLIDNGGSFVPEASKANGMTQSALADVPFEGVFKLNQETINGVKNWLKRLGWDESVEVGSTQHGAMWYSIAGKLDEFVSKYEWDVGGAFGDKSSMKEVVWRLQNIVDRDFTMKASEWARSTVGRTKL